MVIDVDLILVCLLPSLRDLEIARLLGWYRIPLRTAPKVIAVDRLAFYQPGSFGDRGGLIEWTAVVRGHELATRRELFQNEADHLRAGEEYYKIQIGPLEKLRQPISAERWRRLTFLYTTGEHLVNAKTVSDLVVQNEERSILWHSLRERAAQEQSYHCESLELDLSPETLISLFVLPDEQGSAVMEITEI
jgi:hypothetical protein